MSETVMLTSNPYAAKTASAGPARWVCRCRGCNCACRTTRASLPNGRVGGIEVKGPNVFNGYWRMPEKTAEEFTPDWFKTGESAG